MGNATAVKERRDYVLDAIKEGTYKNSEIAELFGVSLETVRTDVVNLRKKYPQIKHYGTGGKSKYSWVNEVEDGHKYSVKKNEEGYNDPTASAAIINMDKDIYGEFTPGDVWWVSASNRTTEKYLVLQSFAGCATCLQVISRDNCNYNPVIHVCVNMQYNEVVDCRRILSKPSRYFLEKDDSYHVTNFDTIRYMVANLNGLYNEPVEKIIEKKVEVPVEKIVEKRVEVPVALPSDEVEMALTKQKADIYEQITWALLYNIRGKEEVIG